MFPIKDNIPTDRFPVVTVCLIAVNVLMFFFFQKASISLTGAALDDLNTVEYGAIPYELTHPGEHCTLAPTGQVVCEGIEPIRVIDPPPTWITPFTSMFMHGGILHIAGNMLFLWIFGNNIEDSMGPVRFLAFYLLGGLAALGLETLVSPDSTVPTIGASGAVAAVLGGYIVLYRHARILTVVFIIVIFTVIELPATVMLGLWFAQQVLFGVLNLTDPTGGGAGIAFFAHIGGFLFGLAAIRLFAQRVKDVPPRLPVY